ncbi:hypothetical protein [Spiroplasma endosymbiont of Crioceris asparagi]|uniref:DUF7916 family protein n=1 Tax=Spiroplasma endosymbiont of Crioceris asparagi TaxID=3066286 RepID=UPI0030D1159F
MKRYLSMNASEIKATKGKNLIEAIKNSEGRILVSENIVTLQPLLQSITNSELACAFGADILFLNLFDVENPSINGMPNNIEKNNLIKELKEMTGRSIGVNLEPVDKNFFNKEQNEFWSITNGRLATKNNARKLCEMGVDFIVLTGNPGNGISKTAIIDSIKEIKKELQDKIIIVAGKMHSAGVDEKIISEKEINDFAQAGADVILIPAPGTVPGIDLCEAKKYIDQIHKLGKLALTAIGTSQEGSDEQTIKQIALYAKMAGADMHHIGDTGFPGLALPENIKTYSIAIRGVRHTYLRMASSTKR